MPFPPGPAKAPWRAVVARFLARYYGVRLVAPEAAFLEADEERRPRLADLDPLVHDSGPGPPVPKAGRAFLARQLLEAQAGGRAIPDGPVARLAALDFGSRLRVAFQPGTRHDDLASGQAMAFELVGALWDETDKGRLVRPAPGSEGEDGLFDRVEARLKVRRALAPDLDALQDASRRLIRVRVCAARPGTDGVLLALRAQRAEEYPGIWGLALSEWVGPAHGRLADALGRATGRVDSEGANSSMSVGWDLLDGSLTFLLGAWGAVEAARTPARTLREVTAGGEAEFLRRSPVDPTAASVLGRVFR